MFCSIQGIGIFNAIVKRIAFLISLLDCSLLAYKNAFDIHILTLYPITLLNLFISSNSHFVNALGFSICKVILSMNRNSLTFSFTS